MDKKNCWEILNCGREVDGSHVAEFGVCPAYTLQKANGIHSGMNGGRCCWAISGTFCGGKVQGSFASKLSGCMSCNFYKQVTDSEDNILSAKRIIEMTSK